METAFASRHDTEILEAHNGTMCGRYTLRTTASKLVERLLFTTDSDDELAIQEKPRFNVAPTQAVLCVRQTSEGERKGQLMKWGLIPSWAKDPAIGARMINARAESVGEKPSFRSAYRRRRCLVPADGYYEWKKEGKVKQPYFFRMRDDQPFAFAGLWEVWKKEDEPPLFSCTIITTDPNSLQRPIHDRMPVILSPSHYDRWLDRSFEDRDVLDTMLVPYDSDKMMVSPVSRHVNNARHDDPHCLDSADEGRLF